MGYQSGQKKKISATFTRPANTTAYSAGDTISDSLSATTPMTFTGAARNLGGSGWIVGAYVSTNKTGVTSQLRVRLYSSAPTGYALDNAATPALYADVAKRVGVIDLPALAAPAAGGSVDFVDAEKFDLRIPFVCAIASQDLIGVLEAIDAMTPDSGQSFTVTLLVEMD